MAVSAVQTSIETTQTTAEQELSAAQALEAQARQDLAQKKRLHAGLAERVQVAAERGDAAGILAERQSGQQLQAEIAALEIRVAKLALNTNEANIKQTEEEAGTFAAPIEEAQAELVEYQLRYQAVMQKVRTASSEMYARQARLSNLRMQQRDLTAALSAAIAKASGTS